MINKLAYREDTVLVSILPPPEVIEFFMPFFGEEIFEGVGPHITLCYLGQRSEEEFVKIVKALRGIRTDIKPVDLSVTGAGCFRSSVPGQDPAQVALINGVGLDLWHLRIKLAMKRTGLLPPPKWGFIPHMTLAYKEPEPGPGPGWEKPLLIDESLQPWRANSFTVSRGPSHKLEIKLK